MLETKGIGDKFEMFVTSDKMILAELFMTQDMNSD